MTDNKYIAVTYKLCSIEDERLIPIEEATKENPFVFISGFGFTLSDFENNIVPLEKGEKFDFVLQPEQAYGIIDENNIFELNRELFCIDGKFDEKNIFIDAIIPMRDENGQLFRARVDDITDDKVKLDFNHPLAGKTLNFIGSVLENRIATNAEIESFINAMSNDGCCGGCANAGEDCDKSENGCCKKGNGNGKGCCHNE
jgi:FKBP-type peptidyl-prolyl cis-trans isomerase SlyD